jgi:1-acyl-sn-glycerol-3-phosphate acyltransferase
MRFSYSLCVAVTRAYLKILGNYEIIHKERLKDWVPCIVAANHISYHDPPFIGSILPEEISYMAKKELFANPIIGWFLRYLNSLPVTRGRIDRELLAEINSLLKKGNSILMFPEGSRKSFTVKPGIGILAYETKVSILPVYIENSNKIVQCLMRKKSVRIIIGERIDTKMYRELPANKDTYRKIAEDIMNEINRLRDEHQTG